MKKIISLITLITFLTSNLAYGYDNRGVSGQVEKSHLRIEQPAKAKGAGDDMASEMQGEPVSKVAAAAGTAGEANAAAGGELHTSAIVFVEGQENLGPAKIVGHVHNRFRVRYTAGIRKNAPRTKVRDAMAEPLNSAGWAVLLGDSPHNKERTIRHIVELYIDSYKGARQNLEIIPKASPAKAHQLINDTMIKREILFRAMLRFYGDGVRLLAERVAQEHQAVQYEFVRIAEEYGDSAEILDVVRIFENNYWGAIRRAVQRIAAKAGAAGGAAEAGAGGAADGILKLSELLTKPDDYDWQQAGGVDLSGHYLGTTDKDGVISFNPKINYRYRWAALGSCEAGWDAVIDSNEIKDGCFYFKVKFTKEGKPDRYRTFVIGRKNIYSKPIKRRLIGENEQKSKHDFVWAILDAERVFRAGLAELARIVTRPDNYNFRSYQNADFRGYHLGRTNENGSITFAPEKNFRYIWHILGFAEAGWAAVIEDNEVKEGCLYIKVRLDKEGRQSIRRTFIVGLRGPDGKPLKKDIYSIKKGERGKHISVWEIVPEVHIPTPALDKISGLVAQPTDYNWEKCRYLDFRGYLGKNDTVGAISFNPFENYRYRWSALGFCEAGWDANIVASGVIGDSLRLRVRFTKEGKEPLYRVFAVGVKDKDGNPKRKKLFGINKEKGNQAEVWKIVPLCRPKQEISSTSGAKGEAGAGGTSLGEEVFSLPFELGEHYTVLRNEPANEATHDLMFDSAIKISKAVESNIRKEFSDNVLLRYKIPLETQSGGVEYFSQSVVLFLITNAMDAIFKRIDDGQLDKDSAVIDAALYVDKVAGTVSLVLSEPGVGIGESIFRQWEQGKFFDSTKREWERYRFLGSAGKAMADFFVACRKSGLSVFFESKRENEPAWKFSWPREEKLGKVAPSERQNTGTTVTITGPLAVASAAGAAGAGEGSAKKIPSEQTNPATYPGRLRWTHYVIRRYLSDITHRPLIVVDIGIGGIGAPTFFELADFLTQEFGQDVKMVGVDNSDSVVTAAIENIGNRKNIRIEKATFTTLENSEVLTGVALVRMANVLNFYKEGEIETVLDSINRSLIEGGILIECEGSKPVDYRIYRKINGRLELAESFKLSFPFSAAAAAEARADGEKPYRVFKGELQKYIKMTPERLKALITEAYPEGLSAAQEEELRRFNEEVFPALEGLRVYHDDVYSADTACASVTAVSAIFCKGKDFNALIACNKESGEYHFCTAVDICGIKFFLDIIGEYAEYKAAGKRDTQDYNHCGIVMFPVDTARDIRFRQPFSIYRNMRLGNFRVEKADPDTRHSLRVIVQPVGKTPSYIYLDSYLEEMITSVLPDFSPEAAAGAPDARLAGKVAVIVSDRETAKDVPAIVECLIERGFDKNNIKPIDVSEEVNEGNVEAIEELRREIEALGTVLVVNNAAVFQTASPSAIEFVRAFVLTPSQLFLDYKDKEMLIKEIQAQAVGSSA